MTINQVDHIIKFRDSVPILQQNQDLVFLNSSLTPPLNTIVSDSLTNYINKGLYQIHPKAEFVNDCEETRKELGRFLNTQSENIAFTRDASEGLNLFQRSTKWERGDNVVIIDGEHPSLGFGWLGLEKDGLEIRIIQTDESQVKPFTADDFKPFIDSNTKAIGISSVMFHSGLKNDIKSIVKEFKPKGIHILVDATQEVGFGKIDVQDLAISAMAFSVHKGLNIPNGLGVLYIEPETIPLLKSNPPVLCSGNISNLDSSLKVNKDFKVFPNAQRYEHSNKPMMQIIALGSYLRFLNSIGMENVETYLTNLSSSLRSKLSSIGLKVIGPNDSKSRSSHSNVLPLIDPKWMDFFKSKNVYVSQYRCGVRISLGIYNNESDVDEFVKIVKEGLDSGLKVNSV
ncbi:Serine hydroxymethyltransferase [Wickerhamomyces ciferrii]|uniref:Serine hydroxymethyltransferase n=1 Tax=Wickerhamomyces ciferrii (strain ATCC 14091 / BCRC 22168 / CBS 111 / JCM 3599 / NBRC 0793 / NRRL Y-1031 F-60-10) TaxID=1206466 RepID=K0KZ98_WICCF|nr:Serine hydroxymethyltransferase [Wickerhamomyces ciferrii]CCH46684.1 Serine hydroxymethyltransferase [Wickerhamomyces ciferrii]